MDTTAFRQHCVVTLRRRAIRADATGPKVDQGALLRYLNETMWFPAAALSPYITWQDKNANSATATMSYESVTAAATLPSPTHSPF